MLFLNLQIVAGDNSCSELLLKSNSDEFGSIDAKEAMGYYTYLGAAKSGNYDIFWKNIKADDKHGPFFLYFGSKQWFVTVIIY